VQLLVGRQLHIARALCERSDGIRTVARAPTTASSLAISACNVSIFPSRAAVAAGCTDGDRTDGEHGLVALTPFPRKVDSPSRRPDVFKRAARLALVSCSRMRQFGNGAVTAQATGSREQGHIP
jgi:hypothetical protein